MIYLRKGRRRVESSDCGFELRLSMKSGCIGFLSIKRLLSVCLALVYHAFDWDKTGIRILLWSPYHLCCFIELLGGAGIGKTLYFSCFLLPPVILNVSMFSLQGWNECLIFSFETAWLFPYQIGIMHCLLFLEIAYEFSCNYYQTSLDFFSSWSLKCDRLVCIPWYFNFHVPSSVDMSCVPLSNS